MKLVPGLELFHGSIAGQPRARTETARVDRLVEMGSWMIVLGTIRLVCSSVDLAGEMVEAYRVDPVWSRMIGRFVQEHHPIIALTFVWPLLLGLALRKTRWPQLLPAAAITFLILSIGGILALTAGWSSGQTDGLLIGSFHISRRVFFHAAISDVSLVILGLTQLAMELATALRALWLAPELKRAPGALAGAVDGARRARLGRLCMYTSLGFLVVMIRLPIWATYLEILDSSPLVRQFVLEDDAKRRRAPRPVARPTVEEQRLRATSSLLTTALLATQSERFLTAKDTYAQIIASLDAPPEKGWPRGYETTLAEALNNLAWLLSTCPEIELREPKRAVECALRAVEFEGGNGNYWNTLGVAYYRTGDMTRAGEALQKSIAGRDQGDSFDWFFLALIDHKRGRESEARTWYDQAVAWARERRPHNRELYRFQLEAAEALGLPAPAQPPALEGTPTSPVGAFSLHKRGRMMGVQIVPEQTER
jgi:tetratricopeptide (TPR) repeat protein